MRRPAALLAIVVLAACSSKVSVSPMPDGSRIDGIPFRPVALYEIKLYQRQADGGWKQLEEPVRRPLPDQDHIYRLRYRGLPFSNTTAKVTLNRDGTLKEVRLKDESQADEALKATGEQLQAIDEKLEARETARVTHCSHTTRPSPR